MCEQLSLVDQQTLQVQRAPDFTTLVLPASTVSETDFAMSIIRIIAKIKQTNKKTNMIFNFVDSRNQNEVLSQILISHDETISLFRTNIDDCYQQVFDHLQHSGDAYNYNVDDDEFSTVYIKFNQRELIKAIELEHQIMRWENIDVTKLACFCV
jgi:hypothetical protein